MTVSDIIKSDYFTVINEGDDTDRAVECVFCCDLLSIAMGRAPAGSAWVTVMGNINTLAVATLADVACIVLAEGASMDENAAKKAEMQGITVLASKEPVFDAALKIHGMIK